MTKDRIKSTGPFLDFLALRLKESFGKDTGKLCVVFPSRRAVAFFRESLASAYQETVWAPALLSIEDFIKELSGSRFPDPLLLVFELYRIFQSEMRVKMPDWNEPLDAFFAWGETLLRDFDEVDKYLVDPTRLFTNILDLKRIEAEFGLSERDEEAVRRFWEAIEGEGSSPLQARFLLTWEILPIVYQKFRDELRSRSLAYEGMAYREVAETLQQNPEMITYEKVIFAGFNALSKAEETLINALLKEKKAEIYWDADEFYLRPEIDAGMFIRYFHGKWKGKGSYLYVHDMLSVEKEIRVTGVSQESEQARYLGNLLEVQNLPAENTRQHAIVLANEHLMFPVLYSLPEKVGELNITMGFPLRQTNVYQLLLSLSQLLRNMKPSESGSRVFHHTEVIHILLNPYVRFLLQESGYDLVQEIRGRNMIYVPASFLLERGLPPLLSHIFDPPVSAQELPGYYETLFGFLLSDAQEREAHLEAEYIYHFFTRFQLLQEVLREYPDQLSLVGFSRIFKELMQGIRVPFEGEPLVGMQLMGFLETRLLDFEQIYMLSVNEGYMPSTSPDYSFIPFNLRKGYGLPTFEERDAIYAYHFFRLLQRTEKAHLIYTSEVKSGGSPSELSRFVRQIRHYFRDSPNIHVHEQLLSTDVPYALPEAIRIPFTETIREILDERYRQPDEDNPEKGNYFSASALSAYISCPLKFYFRYVAGIKEGEEVEENMEDGSLGQILHAVMEKLYRNYKGNPIPQGAWAAFPEKVMVLLEMEFRERGWGWGEKLIGKNYLYRDIIARLCRDVIQTDAAEPPFEILELEARGGDGSSLRIGDNAYRIDGILDRVDRMAEDGSYRILDYKTGRVDLGKKNATIADCFEDPKLKEVMQGYLYAWLFRQRKPDADIRVGYYVVRSLKEGIRYLREGTPISDDDLQTFETHLSALLENIFSADFIQTEDEKRCVYCPYKGICDRG